MQTFAALGIRRWFLLVIADYLTAEYGSSTEPQEYVGVAYRPDVRRNLAVAQLVG